MKIHYFQRYHAKENVATANTMLLLSRLYQYSTDKFFRFLNSWAFPEGFESEIVFQLQEKNDKSVLDATITQDSFKIAVETKLSDWFYTDQLERHLSSFKNEKQKVLLTLAPEYMETEKRKMFESRLATYNASQDTPIRHVNTTFEELVNRIQEVIDDRDYEMQEVLEDYLNYCYHDGLIPVSDGWKFMRVQLAGTTFDFNVRENLYYDNIERGFRAHRYLGLYKNKSVRAVGEVIAIITGVKDQNGALTYQVEQGELTEERKKAIERAILDGKQYGYELVATRFFFVKQFYETDFRKSTPRAPMGTRIFDLTTVLGSTEIPDTEHLAQILSQKTWE
ncbi:hypothetical protein [Faecalibacterium gallinarum]|uniref:PD-(D/E)XK nuclease superfamily protein n=1 Tax=Faecalibacterium gallinarum TaxID=2903556 RepID=A0AA37IZF8_9FIRM|nr:hypothetical protein [Faecalibacterium gallinarum]GJN65035.1 hypothetical protein JCM17207_16600 [Faecalibacterium gallinarum]